MQTSNRSPDQSFSEELIHIEGLKRSFEAKSNGEITVKINQEKAKGEIWRKQFSKETTVETLRLKSDNVISSRSGSKGDVSSPLLS